MGIVSHIFVLLAALRREDIEQLAPAERQRFADTLRHWATLAERGDPPAGVLGDLGRGDRDGDG